MKILLVNEVGLSDKDLNTIAEGVERHANKVAQAYKLEPVETIALTYSGNFEASPSAAAYRNTPKVFLTERQNKPLKPYERPPLAWRSTDYYNVPISYASLRASVKPFGVYKKPFILKGRQINPARMRSGLISVVAHEVSEMIVSPLMDNFTLPDSAGKSWRVEVCDPVLGAYYYEAVDGVDCVFPDFVLPSFWDVKASGPYSYLGTAKAPMVWARGSYAWFKTGVSRLLTRVTF
jgi:hypothetical protein